jgi:hypothetical protein
LAKKKSEHRRERRDPCGVKVDYILHAPDCDKRDCGPWSNVTVDISYSGMGLYTDRNFTEGEKLKIFLRHLSNDPVLAEVRWCNVVSDSLYRIGLRYC